MQHNVRIKIECQNWPYDLHFSFWNLGLRQVFLLFLYISFQRSQKIELKTQLPLVSKKKTRTEFWRYGKSVLYKFFLYKFSKKCTEPIFHCDFFDAILCAIFRRFFLKTDVLVHNFWNVYPEVKMFGIFGIYRPFPFTWEPTWLHLDKILFSLYIGKMVNVDLKGNLI